MEVSVTIAVMMALFSYVASQNNTSDKCICVTDRLCRKINGTIIMDEDLMIGSFGREPKCDNTQVCCQFPNQTTTSTTTLCPPVDIQKCGFRNPDCVRFIQLAEDQNREAGFAEFPWMVRILLPHGRYKCGGSLIHPSVVLTAAHCIVQRKTNYTVRAGAWDITRTNKVFKHQDRLVSSIKIHEDYYGGGLHNDIALLFLESPFVLDQHIRLVCLPPSNTVDDASRCFGTGWGKDYQDDHFSPILKKIDLPMVPRDTCQKNLRATRLGRFFQLHRSFVCARGGGKDSCIGDGGGPLVCPINETEERYQQIGIVSWGIGCDDEDVPSVYASVAFFRNWIDQQMKANNYDVNGYQY